MNATNKTVLNSDLTVVVCTCDSYSDVLSLFFAAFYDYWPSCPYPIVINTEKKTDYKFPVNMNLVFIIPGATDC